MNLSEEGENFLDVGVYERDFFLSLVTSKNMFSRDVLGVIQDTCKEEEEE